MVHHTQINQCNTLHKQKKEQKAHDYINRYRKSLLQNLTSMIKTLKKVCIEGPSPNLIKVYYEKVYYDKCIKLKN